MLTKFQSKNKGKLTVGSPRHRNKDDINVCLQGTAGTGFTRFSVLCDFVKIGIRLGFYKKNGFFYDSNNQYLFKDDLVFIVDLYVHIV